MLVRREADRMIRIPSAKEVDLVELQVAVLARIQRYAVIDREREIAVLEEDDEVVKVLERAPSGGDDDGLAGRGDLLNEHPVVAVGTGDLEDLHTKLLTQVDGGFIERRGHRHASGFAGGLDQGAVLLGAHLRVERLLDVADV